MRNYLVVDDNLPLAENLAEILGDTGARVSVATSGPEALAKLIHYHYDALVTDMRMPGMSGAQLAHEVRRVDPGLPVALITAHSGEADLDEARREGLIGVLPKPVPISSLLQMVERAKRGGVVAVIEDDSALRDNLQEILGLCGFTVVAGSSAEEIERLALCHPVAALIDIRLAGEPDGEALRRFSERLPQMPIFVMTGLENPIPDVPHRRVFGKPLASEVILAELEAVYRAWAS